MTVYKFGGLLSRKPSLTGWCREEHEVQRFYTLCKVELGTKYYNNTWGLEWSHWMHPDASFSVGAFDSYAVQKAGNKAIGVVWIKSSVSKSHTLNVVARIQGLKPISDNIQNVKLDI